MLRSIPTPAAPVLACAVLVGLSACEAKDVSLGEDDGIGLGGAAGSEQGDAGWGEGSGGNSPEGPPDEGENAGRGGRSSNLEPCHPLECGPAPGMTSLICPDGSMAGLVCVRDNNERCEWRITDCPSYNPPSLKTCDQCENTEYCEIANCGRDGEQGFCLPRPEICFVLYAPVCGCDGHTYGNACEASAAGTSIDFPGECWTTDPREPTCGGITDQMCRRGQYCEYPPGVCGAGDVQGICQPRPDMCDMQYDPVCGCDGNTYGNACSAAGAGVSIDHPGEC